MKRTTLLLAALLALFPAAGLADEILVQTTATRVDLNTAGRKGVEVLNLGPNSIWCAVQVTLGVTPTIVSGKARKIASGDSWAINLSAGRRLYCLADTANQVTGAATVVTEAR